MQPQKATAKTNGNQKQETEDEKKQDADKVRSDTNINCDTTRKSQVKNAKHPARQRKKDDEKEGKHNKPRQNDKGKNRQKNCKDKKVLIENTTMQKMLINVNVNNTCNKKRRCSSGGSVGYTYSVTNKNVGGKTNCKAKFDAKMKLHYKVKDSRERIFLVIADEAKIIYKDIFLSYFKHYLLNNLKMDQWDQFNKTKFNKLSNKEQEKLINKFFYYLSNNKDMLSFSMFVKRVNDDGDVLTAFLNWVQSGHSRQK